MKNIAFGILLVGLLIIVGCTGTEKTNGTAFDKSVEDLEPIMIESHVPGSSDPFITLGEDLNFFITLNRDASSIIWYVDGEQVKENTDNFVFTPKKTGDFKVSVTVSDNDETDDYEWKVNVNEEAAVQAALADLCGNGIVDVGENCETCSEDVSFI